MFALIKKPLLILLLIGAIGGGIYAWKIRQGQVLGQETAIGEFVDQNFPQAKQLIEKLPFTNSLINSPALDSNFVENSVDLTTQQLQTLSENGTKVKDQLLDFVSQIKESTQSSPLHERALEYGQYLYCQQVIKEYED